MKCYKGFDKNLQCRDFQYEIGKSYTEIFAEICLRGFHACEFPLNVFKYYQPSSSRFCEVELSANHQKAGDTKRVGRHIEIKKEIGILELVNESIEYIKNNMSFDDSYIISTEHPDVSINTFCHSTSVNSGDKGTAINTGFMSMTTNTGERSAATNTGSMSAAISKGKMSVAINTGGYSVATNQGYMSAAINTGDGSAAANTGDMSTSTNTGSRSAATNMGYKSISANTGNRSIAINAGNCSVAANTGEKSLTKNTGNYSAAINLGDTSVASVEGKESVAIAIGYKGKAKGGLGCFLVLADWRLGADRLYHIADVKSVKVDGVNIKADTFYTLENNEFVEVEE